VRGPQGRGRASRTAGRQPTGPSRRTLRVLLRTGPSRRRFAPPQGERRGSAKGTVRANGASGRTAWERERNLKSVRGEEPGARPPGPRPGVSNRRPPSRRPFATHAPRAPRDWPFETALRASSGRTAWERERNLKSVRGEEPGARPPGPRPGVSNRRPPSRRPFATHAPRAPQDWPFETALRASSGRTAWERERNLKSVRGEEPGARPPGPKPGVSNRRPQVMGQDRVRHPCPRPKCWIQPAARTPRSSLRTSR
jgi:hypothetical protein